MERADTIYDDFYVLFFDLTQEYGEIYESYITTALLNVLLVLTGARTACIIDSIRTNIPLLNKLLTLLKEYYNISTIELSVVEYLLFLTVNKNSVIKQWNLNKADLLGYCYNKNDFANVDIDRVTVKYVAISTISGSKYPLFITVIPTYAYYEKSIQKCIVDKASLFNNILNNVDYNVTVSIENF